MSLDEGGSAGRVIFVEDDAFIVRFFQRVLREARFEVVAAGSVAEGRRALLGAHDAVLLDVELPDASGLTLLEELRARGDRSPVIILTGRGGDEEVVRGLDAGADDYIEKPVGGAVLLARLRAVIRRGAHQATGRREAGVLSLGPLTLDRLARRATVDGQVLDLTPKEFTLLEYLLLCAEETVTRAELLDHVWELQGEPESNVVDAHMARLRAKLRAVSDRPDILTVRGKGFVLTAA
ncbi:DNA-binding response regulator [Gemmatimonadetes bacterium T265]|nr:DNA-binding response regulator [Gemmatimonadetes bacterium T265]